MTEEFNLSTNYWELPFNLSDKVFCIDFPALKLTVKDGLIRTKDVQEFMRLLKLELRKFYPNSKNEITMRKVYLLLEPYYEIIDRLAGEKLKVYKDIK